MHFALVGLKTLKNLTFSFEILFRIRAIIFKNLQPYLHDPLIWKVNSVSRRYFLSQQTCSEKIKNRLKTSHAEPISTSDWINKNLYFDLFLNKNILETHTALNSRFVREDKMCAVDEKDPIQDSKIFMFSLSWEFHERFSFILTIRCCFIIFRNNTKP